MLQAPEVVIRRARTPDIGAVAALVRTYSDQRILLAKETVTLYEAVQEFQVAEVRSGPEAGRIVGCGATHVLWEDLAEIRTIAVDPSMRGAGVGHLLLEALIGQAVALGVTRVFCLTFEVGFFSQHGFHEIEGTPVTPEVYAEMLRSMDEGVAEFLDLARVKPNTLGNHRMLLELKNE